MNYYPTAKYKCKEVEVFDGREKDLMKKVKFYEKFDKVYCLVIFASIIFMGYALIKWDIFQKVVWNSLFFAILVVAFCMLIWAAKKENTFKKVNRVKKFTFVVDSVQVVEDGGMIVLACKADDKERMFKHHFYFDTAFDFNYDFFILHQVNLNGHKNFFYCRKGF